MKSPKSPSRIRIQPSAKDPIASWLDVMSSMLEMPEAQRKQVRDELEDHLRSRVDDLLISGNTEHEAIRIAVEELGETAEIAKHISHAHIRPSRRRTIMNTAVITAALAGMSFGWMSLSNTMSSNIPADSMVVTQPATTITLDVTQGMMNASDPSATHVFEYDSFITLHVMLSDIAQAFGRKLELSPEFKQHPHSTYLSGVNGFIEGEMTFQQAIAHFQSLLSSSLMDYQILQSDRVLKLVSESDYQRSIIVNRVYPNPSWITQPSEQENYAGSLRELLGVKFDLEFTSIQLIGDSIVVAATPTIHDEFVKLTAELDEVIGNRDAEVKRRNDQAQQAMEQRKFEFEQRLLIEQRDKQAQRQVQIEEIQREFDSIREILFATKEQLRAITSETYAIGRDNNDFAPMDPEVRKANDQKLYQLAVEQERLQFTHDEIEERYYFIRSRLLDSQYADLFEGLE